MVMAKPFSTTSPILANFSYNEIASGSGIIEFYLYSAYSNTTPTTVYKISDNSNIYSNNYSITGAGTRSTGFVLASTTIFDSSIFKVTRMAEGTATVIVTTSGYSSAYTGYGRVDVSLWHVTGATETQLGATVRSNQAQGSSGTTGYATSALTFDIQQKVFREGDFLRVKVALYEKTSNGSGDGKGGFLFDPSNRTVGTAERSQFSIKLPFDIV